MIKSMLFIIPIQECTNVVISTIRDLYFIIHGVIIKMLRGIEAIRNQNRKVIYMLDVLNNKVELSNVHFAEHKLTIEDAKAMLENEGWIATK